MNKIYQLPYSITESINQVTRPQNVNNQTKFFKLTQSKILKGRQHAMDNFVTIHDTFYNFSKGVPRSPKKDVISGKENTQPGVKDCELNSSVLNSTNLEKSHNKSLSLNNSNSFLQSSILANNNDNLAPARRLQLFRRLRLSESARRGRTVSSSIRRSRDGSSLEDNFQSSLVGGNITPDAGNEGTPVFGSPGAPARIVANRRLPRNRTQHARSERLNGLGVTNFWQKTPKILGLQPKIGFQNLPLEPYPNRPIPR